MTNMEYRDKNFNILLVEDNAADILLLEEAIADLGLELDLHVVNNGEEAMSYLMCRPPYEDAVRPDLILLDLNLPRKNGFDVLEEIKDDRYLLQIPVIILSTSRAEEDINRCYLLSANCFVNKPSDLEQFIEVMRSLASFWLNTACLPNSGK